MFEPPTPRPTPADPWGHEVGEDASHLLDAWGHVRHQREPLGRLVAPPEPIRPQPRLNPAVAYGVLLLAAAVIAAALVLALN
jgi:hypothetical protein